ncbi:phosphonate ABC transporter, permease protein PhnE [Gracilibacillus salitolerans]|uniref:Phosphonate ABC transporter, permease protein PhnE n=1 Tax=Gracilibacillus salitolerans TaxID=2663022 RepID=A0A5Q2TP18_9BACI|nr:phosphonate ABC transporter, permease protein PhnE [Gracilibacillus salitolerans]QGH36709.1 phosphonate ABC transporter, permease protein PhnE [Gracilibacillus salitolerans]
MSQQIEKEKHDIYPLVSTDKEDTPKPEGDRFLKGIVICGVVLFVVSLYQLNIDYTNLWAGTLAFFSMLGDMFPPDFSEWQYVIPAAIESLQVAILGTVIAVVISLVLAFIAAENLSANKLVPRAVKGFATLMRVIPTIIWALIFIVAVGLGPLPGVLAIAVHSLGMLIKVFAQSVEEMDDGKIEALKASGANWFQIIAQGVIPTVFTALLSWTILRLEIDIGESTILGLVGAGGIGWELTRAMRTYDFNSALFITMVIFVMIFSVEMISNRLKLKV